jgi:hypothetical protein
MTAVLLICGAVLVLSLVCDRMWQTTRRTRRQLHVAIIRADRAVEDACWEWVRDEDYRLAMAITLSRAGAVRVDDLAALLERADRMGHLV